VGRCQVTGSGFFMSKIIDLIKLHEGFRAKPYRCTQGRTTIGWGRNIQDNGITELEAELMLINDVSESCAILKDRVSGFSELCEVRQAVLIDMVFNLGWPRFSRFKKMILAVESRAFELAALEMEDSNWYRQVASRAVTLVEMMKTGEWA